MLGVGDGTFTARPQHIVTGNSGSEQVALGDLNGDGKLDLVWEDLVASQGDAVMAGGAARKHQIGGSLELREPAEFEIGKLNYRSVRVL